MRWRIAAFVALLLALPSAAVAEALGEARWQSRPFLIFAPAGDDPRAARQLALLSEAGAGIGDRRLAVYVVEPRVAVPHFGAPTMRLDVPGLRRRFGIDDDGFRVVLVGLDGGGKLVRDEPVDAASLFATIDAMPMRRRELRERGAAN